MISVEDFKKDIATITYPDELGYGKGRLIIPKKNIQDSVQWCVDLITTNDSFVVKNGMIYFFPNIRILLKNYNFHPSKNNTRKKPLVQIFTNSEYIGGDRNDEVFAISACFSKLFGYSTRVNLIDIGIYLEDVEGLYNLYRLEVDDAIPKFNDVFKEVNSETHQNLLSETESEGEGYRQGYRQGYREGDKYIYREGYSQDRKDEEYRYLNRIERESDAWEVENRRRNLAIKYQVK